MTAERLYDYKRINVDKAPSWLIHKEKGIIYYFILENVCYALKPYDSRIGASQEVTYLIKGKLYVSHALMTATQFINLRETHTKTDGFEKVSIWEFLEDYCQSM